MKEKKFGKNKGFCLTYHEQKLLVGHHTDKRMAMMQYGWIHRFSSFFFFFLCWWRRLTMTKAKTVLLRLLKDDDDDSTNWQKCLNFFFSSSSSSSYFCLYAHTHEQIQKYTRAKYSFDYTDQTLLFAIS